jgi:hypothetical protein
MTAIAQAIQGAAGKPVAARSSSAWNVSRPTAEPV